MSSQPKKQRHITRNSPPTVESYRNMIGSIINTDTHSLFNVTTRNLIQLEDIISQHYFLLEDLTLKEWHELYSVDNVLFPGTKGKKYSGLKESQIHRAERLIAYTLQYNKNRIIYLDGHGRMTLCMIEAMINQDVIDKFELVVIEEDKNMHKWHKRIYPEDVQKIRGSIIEFLSDKFINTSSHMYLQESMIYLNFCGVGDHAMNVMSLLDNIVQKTCVMISFSIRCKEKESSQNILLERYIQKLNHILITKNKDMMTYFLPQQDDEIEIISFKKGENKEEDDDDVEIILEGPLV